MSARGGWGRGLASQSYANVIGGPWPHFIRGCLLDMSEMDAKAAKAAAEVFKAEGNTHFANKDLRSALVSYDKGIPASRLACRAVPRRRAAPPLQHPDAQPPT